MNIPTQRGRRVLVILSHSLLPYTMIEPVLNLTVRSKRSLESPPVARSLILKRLSRRSTILSVRCFTEFADFNTVTCSPLTLAQKPRHPAGPMSLFPRYSLKRRRLFAESPFAPLARVTGELVPIPLLDPPRSPLPRPHTEMTLFLRRTRTAQLVLLSYLLKTIALLRTDPIIEFVGVATLTHGRALTLHFREMIFPRGAKKRTFLSGRPWSSLLDTSNRLLLPIHRCSRELPPERVDSLLRDVFVLSPGATRSLTPRSLLFLMISSKPLEQSL